jgi:uncharacterized protein (TIGR04255 family)
MTKEKNKLEPLLFKDFQLEQLVFEFRFIFSKNYLESLRLFWSEIQNELSGEFKLIEQGETATLNYNSKFEIRLTPDRFAVIELYPDSAIKEFLRVARVFYSAAVKFSEIEKLTRVGLRAIYSKDYDNHKLVAEALYQTKYINFPDDLYLIEEGMPLIPSYAIGWQDEEKGISYRLKGKAEKLGVDLPLKLTAKGDFPNPVEKEYNQVILDIDIYIHKHISPGQFFSDEWIKQAHETAKIEGSKFFGER